MIFFVRILYLTVFFASRLKGYVEAEIVYSPTHPKDACNEDIPIDTGKGSFDAEVQDVVEGDTGYRTAESKTLNDAIFSNGNINFKSTTDEPSNEERDIKASDRHDSNQGQSNKIEDADYVTSINNLEDYSETTIGNVNDIKRLLNATRLSKRSLDILTGMKDYVFSRKDDTDVKSSADISNNLASLGNNFLGGGAKSGGSIDSAGGLMEAGVGVAKESFGNSLNIASGVMGQNLKEHIKTMMGVAGAGGFGVEDTKPNMFSFRMKSDEHGEDNEEFGEETGSLGGDFVKNVDSGAVGEMMSGVSQKDQASATVVENRSDFHMRGANIEGRTIVKNAGLSNSDVSGRIEHFAHNNLNVHKDNVKESMSEAKVEAVQNTGHGFGIEKVYGDHISNNFAKGTGSNTSGDIKAFRSSTSVGSDSKIVKEALNFQSSKSSNSVFTNTNTGYVSSNEGIKERTDLELNKKIENALGTSSSGSISENIKHQNADVSTNDKSIVNISGVNKASSKNVAKDEVIVKSGISKINEVVSDHIGETNYRSEEYFGSNDSKANTEYKEDVKFRSNKETNRDIIKDIATNTEKDNISVNGKNIAVDLSKVNLSTDTKHGQVANNEYEEGIQFRSNKDTNREIVKDIATSVKKDKISATGKNVASNLNEVNLSTDTKYRQVAINNYNENTNQGFHGTIKKNFNAKENLHKKVQSEDIQYVKGSFDNRVKDVAAENFVSSNKKVGRQEIIKENIARGYGGVGQSTSNQAAVVATNFDVSNSARFDNNIGVNNNNLGMDKGGIRISEASVGDTRSKAIDGYGVQLGKFGGEIKGVNIPDIKASGSFGEIVGETFGHNMGVFSGSVSQDTNRDFSISGSVGANTNDNLKDNMGGILSGTFGGGIGGDTKSDLSITRGFGASIGTKNTENMSGIFSGDFAGGTKRDYGLVGGFGGSTGSKFTDNSGSVISGNINTGIPRDFDWSGGVSRSNGEIRRENMGDVLSGTIGGGINNNFGLVGSYEGNKGRHFGKSIANEHKSYVKVQHRDNEKGLVGNFGSEMSDLQANKHTATERRIVPTNIFDPNVGRFSISGRLFKRSIDENDGINLPKSISGNESFNNVDDSLVNSNQTFQINSDINGNIPPSNNKNVTYVPIESKLEQNNIVNNIVDDEIFISGTVGSKWEIDTNPNDNGEFDDEENANEIPSENMLEKHANVENVGISNIHNAILNHQVMAFTNQTIEIDDEENVKILPIENAIETIKQENTTDVIENISGKSSVEEYVDAAVASIEKIVIKADVMNDINNISDDLSFDVIKNATVVLVKQSGQFENIDGKVKQLDLEKFFSTAAGRSTIVNLFKALMLERKNIEKEKIVVDQGVIRFIGSYSGNVLKRIMDGIKSNAESYGDSFNTALNNIRIMIKPSKDIKVIENGIETPNEINNVDQQIYFNEVQPQTTNSGMEHDRDSNDKQDTQSDGVIYENHDMSAIKQEQEKANNEEQGTSAVGVDEKNHETKVSIEQDSFVDEKQSTKGIRFVEDTAIIDEQDTVSIGFEENRVVEDMQHQSTYGDDQLKNINLNQDEANISSGRDTVIKENQEQANIGLEEDSENNEIHGISVGDIKLDTITEEKPDATDIGLEQENSSNERQGATTIEVVPDKNGMEKSDSISIDMKQNEASTEKYGIPYTETISDKDSKENFNAENVDTNTEENGNINTEQNLLSQIKKRDTGEINVNANNNTTSEKVNTDAFPQENGISDMSKIVEDRFVAGINKLMPQGEELLKAIGSSGSTSDDVDNQGSNTNNGMITGIKNKFAPDFMKNVDLGSLDALNLNRGLSNSKIPKNFQDLKFMKGVLSQSEKSASMFNPFSNNTRPFDAFKIFGSNLKRSITPDGAAFNQKSKRHSNFGKTFDGDEEKTYYSMLE